MEEIKQYIQQALENIKEEYYIDQNFNFDLKNFKIAITNEKIDAHYSSNILFLINKNLKENGKEELKKHLLKNKNIAQVDFLNGYINFKMDPVFFQNIVKKIENGNIFPDIGKNEKVNLEYCSINPTGFLHIGHARNAILGDSIGRLLSAVNYDVTKEYYINDAGNQIELLAKSVYYEYSKLHNKECEKPENGYLGEEIKEIAKTLKEDLEINKIGEIALQYFLKHIKKDLNDLKIFHDSWISEKEIINSGYIEKAIKILEEKNYLYKGVREEKMAEKGKSSLKELLLLKTTEFGDDEDRPLTKADGSWTYFAPDIGYHLNKIERKATYLICVLGADHNSYAHRIKIAVKALCENIKHATPMCQLVSFEDHGKFVKFSKRAGNSIRCADFIKEIHPDILRFMMLSKSENTPFVFDYENALNVSFKNPMFYIQYAYARACSIFRTAQELKIDLTKENRNQIREIYQIPEFQELIIQLSWFENILTEATNELAPNKIANYAYSLAQTFHKLWQVGKTNQSKRFIVPENVEETYSKLTIINAYKTILAQTLNILGIDAIEKME